MSSLMSFKKNPRSTVSQILLKGGCYIQIILFGVREGGETLEHSK